MQFARTATYKCLSVLEAAVDHCAILCVYTHTESYFTGLPMRLCSCSLQTCCELWGEQFQRLADWGWDYIGGLQHDGAAVQPQHAHFVECGTDYTVFRRAYSQVC